MSESLDDVLARRAALEAELAALEAELAEYQQLTDEIPAIYEEKFRHQLQQLALELRRLMDERDGLQRQIAALLPGSEAAASLPAAVASRAAVAAPVSPGRWSLPSLGPWLRQPRRRLWMAGAAALVCAVGLAALVRRPQAPAVPVALPMARTAALLLRADGECWLELQTLEGRQLYVNTLQAGQSVRLPLSGPVRLRAGRPDLLQLSLDGRTFRPLASVADVGWHRLDPAPAPGSPAAKAS